MTRLQWAAAMSLMAPSTWLRTLWDTWRWATEASASNATNATIGPSDSHLSTQLVVSTRDGPPWDFPWRQCDIWRGFKEIGENKSRVLQYYEVLPFTNSCQLSTLTEQPQRRILPSKGRLQPWHCAISVADWWDHPCINLLKQPVSQNRITVGWESIQPSWVCNAIKAK